MFEYISNIIHRLFGSKTTKAYENICLDSWKQALDDDSRKKLSSQLSSFDLIQRHPGYIKTHFYCINDPSCKSLPEEILFNNTDSELKVFNGRLSGNNKDVELWVEFDIFCHNGRLSSIEFSSEPSLLMNLDTELTVSDSKLLVKVD